MPLIILLHQLFRPIR